MKRPMNGCVVLAMVAGIALALPHIAQADTETVNGIEWTYQIVGGEAWLDNNGYAVIPPETVGDITIPSTLGGCPVTTIWDKAFENCESLTGVTIPDGVTTIGRYAFRWCSSLERFTILGSATEIWPQAFRGCLKLADADGFVIFRNTLYDYCGDAEEVTIPNGVTEIAGYSFYWCSSIKKVTVPDSVTKIGLCAFESCHSLEDVQIPDGVTTIGERAFRDDPLLADENGLVIVCGTVYDYYGESSALTIPSGVTVISYYAFLCDAGKLLNSVTLPSGLIKIGGMAFEDCGELKRVNIPSTVNTMDGGAFYGTALEVVYVEEGDTERVRRMIEESGFDTGNITFVEGAMPGEEFTVTFDADGGTVTPATLKVANGAEIGELPVPVKDGYRFICWVVPVGDGTKRSVQETDKVTADFTCYAFWMPEENTWTDAKGVVWSYTIDGGEATVTSVPETTSGAVTVPATLGGKPVTSIGLCAFEGRAVTSVTIPDGVKSLDECAFASCTSLKSVTISESVTEISDNAFVGCTGLADKDGFAIVRGILCCYTGTATELNIPKGVTRIGERAFEGNTALKSVRIPSGVTSIGATAFAGCTALTSLTIPASVTAIWSGAFDDTALKTVQVEPGDAARVRELISLGDYDVEGLEISEIAIPKYTITFDANGGKVSGDAQVVAEAGLELGELPVATRAGYKFLGWYTEKKGGTAVTAETVVEADATVYAHWVSAWKVTFNANGGQIGGAKTAAVMVQKGKAVGTLPKATRTGYTFKGWYTKKSGGSKISAKTKIKKNITYYAQWTAKKYTVKLTKTGSGKISGGGKKAYKSKITLKATASKGWKFAGWYLGDTLKSKKTTWKTTVPLNGATYTAKFVKK